VKSGFLPFFLIRKGYSLFLKNDIGVPKSADFPAILCRLALVIGARPLFGRPTACSPGRSEAEPWGG